MENYEQCPKCKAQSLAGKKFCADCGSPLDPATIQFKDQQYVALETSVVAAEKLKSWLTLFLFWAGIPLALIAALLAILGTVFGIFGFRNYEDFLSKVTAAKLQVESASANAQRTAEAAQQKASGVSKALGDLAAGVASSQRAVSELQRTAAGLKDQYGQVQSDVTRYRQVNQEIEAVQKELTDVKGQIVDFGNKTLRAGGVEVPPKEGVPGSIAFASLGCQQKPLAKMVASG
jgi:DNA repair exonuclease SbcCD ATPase subunit